MKKAVVLLSSGLDSTYNLWRARFDFEVVLALTFHYGQRSAVREVERSAKLCQNLGIPHQVVELPWFKDFTRSGLVGSAPVPVATSVKIDDFSVSQETARAVWVPNRNGIFLNIGAGFAEGLGADVLIPGFNAEEAATFPDNSAGFMKALDQALAFSTANHVQVQCFSLAMTKSQIVAEALKLQVPLEDLWPCYFAGDRWCGECESCQRFQRALQANGVSL